MYTLKSDDKNCAKNQQANCESVECSAKVAHIVHRLLLIRIEEEDQIPETLVPLHVDETHPLHVRRLDARPDRQLQRTVLVLLNEN